MKKILLLSLMLILCISISFSQFGIKAGINAATWGGDDSKQTIRLGDYEPALVNVPPVVIEPKSKIGLVAGISYKIGLILGLSIQTEALYVQKGVIYEPSTISLASVYPGASVNAKQTMNFGYIEIPVLVKYSFPTPLVSPYIVGGISYGILVSAKSKTEATVNGVPGGPQSQSEETDVKDSMNKSDMSIQAGVGVEVLLLEVDARYVLGLSKIDKDGVQKIYNRGIVLTAGLRF